MANAYIHGLRPEQIDDFVVNTLNHFEKDVWVDISSPLREYFAYSNMLLKDRVGIDGGTKLQWQIKVRNAGSAKNTGMFAVDDVKIADVMKSLEVGWSKQTANFGYDIDEEPLQSGSAVRIVNMIKTRVHAALTDFAELMEINFWGLPLDATTDSELIKPLGVPYWIVRNATKGFNGGLPINTSHSTVAGLSPTTYTQWRNYTGQYAAISKRDLIRMLREAIVKTKFKPPVSHPSPQGKTPRWIIATVYDVEQRLEELAEQQNTNLGNDVASKDGQAMFRRIPITSVPYLEANSDPTGAVSTNQYGKNPVYGIDTESFRLVFKEGAYMRRSKPLVAPEQHTVRHVHWDSWTQFQCFNRRSNFVLTQSA